MNVSSEAMRENLWDDRHLRVSVCIAREEEKKKRRRTFLQNQEAQLNFSGTSLCLLFNRFHSFCFQFIFSLIMITFLNLFFSLKDASFPLIDCKWEVKAIFFLWSSTYICRSCFGHHVILLLLRPVCLSIGLRVKVYLLDFANNEEVAKSDQLLLIFSLSRYRVKDDGDNHYMSDWRRWIGMLILWREKKKEGDDENERVSRRRLKKAEEETKSKFHFCLHATCIGITHRKLEERT